MTTLSQDQITQMSSTIGAFKISINRAVEMGISPDEFIEMFMSEKGKQQFSKLVNSCSNHLTTK